MDTPTEATSELQHVILRTRIGFACPTTTDREDLENRLAAAITETITAAGGTMDLLQIGLAARPDWDHFGPINRVTAAPLWDPGSST